MLRIEGLGAGYGQVRVLKDVCLDVRVGEIVALIGANGAGKTTLLHAVSGLLQTTAGRILLDGKNIAGQAAENVVRLGISHVPERRQVFATMSVIDNLKLGAYHRYRHEPDKAIANDLDEVLSLFPVLRERSRQSAGTLSGGEQQMLALGRGLMAKPKLLLLDEPSLGLAPLIVQEIIRVIATLRERSTTILLVEQNTKAALSIADRGYVMETGRIVSEGTAVELLSDTRVKAAYLGKGRVVAKPSQGAG